MSLTPVSSTTLTALTANLDIGDTADPALRLAYFQYLNAFLTTLLSELGSTTAGTSGAHQIGSAAISGVTGTNINAQIADVFSQLSLAMAATVPNRSLTFIKLALATLTTAEIASDTLAYSNMDINTKTALNGGLIYAYKNLGGSF